MKQLTKGYIMFAPLSDLFCILPVCFHPMTVMLVDDDSDFLNQLSHQLSEHLPVISFSDPDKAIHYFEHQNSEFLKKWSLLKSKNTTNLIQDLRYEMYNENRFKNIMVSVVDYEMPNKTGFDVMKIMGESILGEMSFHSYILLTGKRFSDLDKALATTPTGKNFISKWDPNRVNQLMDSISEKSERTFQLMSYTAARQLSFDPAEKSNILFDGNILPLLNNHIQKHHICELYLFDKQGSYICLDENANLSWFFVRNDLGMQNSIQLAKQYHAPTWVIDAIQSKEMLLSLYEKEDFERIQTLDWKNYMLPAIVFNGDDRYMKFFNLEPHSNYYYAFTQDWANHSIDQKKILSYRSYLNRLD
jgi:CheY-like chemotaxis protein